MPAGLGPGPAGVGPRARGAGAVDLDAGGFEPEAGGVRPAADRRQHLVDDELRPVGEDRRDRVAAALEPLDRAAEPQVDAAPGIGFAEARADVLVEAAQELV